MNTDQPRPPPTSVPGPGVSRYRLEAERYNADLKKEQRRRGTQSFLMRLIALNLVLCTANVICLALFLYRLY